MKQIVTKHIQVVLLLFVFVIISETGDNSDVTRVERRGKADDVENGANCSLVVLWRLLENNRRMKEGSRGRGANRGPADRTTREEEDAGLLRNCSQYGQEEELSITSLTALCHAQCTANCEDLDVDCKDSNCTIYESEEWASECHPDDYDCLEDCSQNETHPMDDFYLYIPDKPTSLTLEQVTAIKVRISWSPASSYPVDDTVLYVSEEAIAPAAEWSIISQVNETWAIVEADVCAVMAFRVASVNKYGTKGYTAPILRKDLPVPDLIIPIDEESVRLGVTGEYFHYEFKFSVPEDWKSAKPIAYYGGGKQCENNILFPPVPFPGTFNRTSDGYVYETYVHKVGYSCTYALQIYLQSSCNVKGAPYTTYINLTDCKNIEGMQCPDPVQPGSGGGSTTRKTTTTTSHESTTTETEPLSSDPSTGSSSAVIYISVASSLAAVAAAGFFVTVGWVVRRKMLRRKAKLPTRMELPALKLEQPLHQLKVNNVLYKSQENYTDIIGRDAWEIAWDCLVLGEVLGEGAFGQVRKGLIEANVQPRWLLTPDANCQSRQMTVAVKMLTGDQSDVYRQDFLREMELMKTIGYHSNVVNMIGCCTRQDPLCLVVEHVALGDLLHYLQDYRAKCQQAHGNGHFEYLTVHDLMNFARQISVGMEFLSQKGFVHRDLAARNVLVGHEKKVKIGDFGLTRYIYDDQVYVTNRGGKLPLKWMAIESIFDLTFTTASDVWSFGIVLYELMTLGGTPYPTISNKDLLRELQKGYRMERPDNCSPEIYRLMIDCWQTRPSRRPTFTQLNRRIAAIMDDSLQSSQPALPTDGFLYENEYKTNSSDSLTLIQCNFPTNSPTETPVKDLKTPNQCTPKLANVRTDCTVNFPTTTPENQQNMSDYRKTLLENELAN